MLLSDETNACVIIFLSDETDEISKCQNIPQVSAKPPNIEILIIQALLSQGMTQLCV